jgi:1-aminocyclopropane-1-carboxylate deaminase/D-cysteine desulfhydrase-like pyridoxal-dependent ACC family enzyme
LDVNADYLGGGYSVVGDLERDAIRTVARTEGLLLDPVYTGRAMGGLIDLICEGNVREEPEHPVLAHGRHRGVVGIRGQALSTNFPPQPTKLVAP